MTARHEHRRFSWRAFALVVGLLVAGCDKSGPENIYYGMVTAAEMGDYDGFLKGFTKQSQQLIQSQLSLSEAYGLKSENPVSMLVFSAVEEIQVEGEQAILSVSRGASKKRILMIKDPEEGWRIDIKKLGDFWDEESKKR